MNFLFELSKEHKTLPNSEIRSCLQSEDIEYKIVDSNEDALVIEADISKNKIQRLADRLSMTYFIDQVLFFSSTEKEILKQKAKINPLKKRVRLQLLIKTDLKILVLKKS